MLSPELLGQDLDRFDCIIDARSPAEYALDHIPGAINCPVLNNEERATVGTLYKQESPFAAKKLGAALVAKNIANHLQEHFIHQPREWRPLVYCWRGGERSGAFAHILQRIGWKAQQLQGGYQGYRRQVIADLERWAPLAKFIVICGMTGSGKTRLLQALHGQTQVLDLEDLAAHRGSVLGGLPNQAQPSQKMFESRLWNALRQFKFNQTIYVESESKKVGCLHIPDALMDQIRQGDCVEIKADRSVRVDVLMQEYVH
ncbi:MAG: tRNA 2-selenouridine(34) synthase MnmH, partial [Burkholderiaceae bacterium]|nr:tRNA 2-selenouridine(34) synthase MnmH [Burkholderiaceae bacterium]